MISITPEFLLSTLLGSGILILIAKLIFKFGEFSNRFITLEEKVANMGSDFQTFAEKTNKTLAALTKSIDNLTKATTTP